MNVKLLFLFFCLVLVKISKGQQFIINEYISDQFESLDFVGLPLVDSISEYVIYEASKSLKKNKSRKIKIRYVYFFNKKGDLSKVKWFGTDFVKRNGGAPISKPCSQDFNFTYNDKNRLISIEIITYLESENERKLIAVEWLNDLKIKKSEHNNPKSFSIYEMDCDGALIRQVNFRDSMENSLVEYEYTDGHVMAETHYRKGVKTKDISYWYLGGSLVERVEINFKTNKTLHSNFERNNKSKVKVLSYTRYQDEIVESYVGYRFDHKVDLKNTYWVIERPPGMQKDWNAFQFKIAFRH